MTLLTSAKLFTKGGRRSVLPVFAQDTCLIGDNQSAQVGAKSNNFSSAINLYRRDHILYGRIDLCPPLRDRSFITGRGELGILDHN